MNLVQQRLAAWFREEQIGWKPQSVKGNRAMAIAYIDARDVMDRLDEVLGIGGWYDRYRELADGSVCCELTCCIDGVWITKVDVGSPSDQPDSGDRMKAAYSDSFKRAAVKFGVGRFLYGLSAQWCDYDPIKREWINPPRLPKRPAATFATESQTSAPASTQPGEQLESEVSDQQILTAVLIEMDRTGAKPDRIVTMLNRKYGTTWESIEDYKPDELRPLLKWLQTLPTQKLTGSVCD